MQLCLKQVSTRVYFIRRALKSSANIVAIVLIEFPLSCYRTKASETPGFMQQKGNLRSLAYMLTVSLNVREQETLPVKCLDTPTSLLSRVSYFK